MPFEDNLAEAHSAYEAGRYSDVLAILNGLVAEAPDNRPVLLLAETLLKLGMVGEAAEAFEHSALRQATAPYPLLVRATSLYLDAGRLEKARMLAEQLHRHNPADPQPAYVLARIQGETAGPALPRSVISALIGSDEPDHLLLAVKLIGNETRNEQNLTLFGKLWRQFPDDPYIRMSLIGFAREFCDYPILEREEEALRSEIAAGNTAALAAETPHYNLMWCGDEALNRLATNVSGLTPPPPGAGSVRRAMPHRWSQKIRIGYLSNDFWDDHATMRLFQSVLTAHDPDRFDVTLFCYTPERFISFDSGSRKTWGRIVRIEALDDEQAIAKIREQGIDILVDLKGHTGGSRSRLMNAPIAPVHVQWLGFPGSCVHVDCDYVIGDRFVLPDSSKPHYHEKFCRLPESYQPNDPFSRAVPGPASRRAFGLPTDRFIFSAFNIQRKNSPEGIALWARVLAANPHALLWLMIDGTHARNATADFLRRAGVKSDQFIFAPKMPYAAHIARVPAADIGLDSFPYNGHTTTSDMLWAGLPVITRRGTNFASRVSQSLLNAIGLPELVATDDDNFVALCSELAVDPERTAMLKEKIAENRLRAPLFDSERFCRHLEISFTTMAERARDGLAPDHFDVPALPSRKEPFRN